MHFFKRSLSPIRALILFAFQTSLITYLLYYLLESFFPKTISQYFNLSILFWITIGLGILEFIPKPAAASQGNSAARAFGWLGIAFIGILVTIIVWIGVVSLGWIAFVIAPLTGILVALVLKLHDDPEIAEGLNGNNERNG